MVESQLVALNISRRAMLRISAAATAALVLPGSIAVAQSAGSAGSSGESSGDQERVRRAIRGGLEWLAEKQREDGSFNTGKYGGDPAIVALAGQAFLAAGSAPGRGNYGAALRRAVDYLQGHVQPTGYLHVRSAASTMYGHGYATAFLAAAYRAAMDEALRTTIASAVELLVDSQSDEGGWRYVPKTGAGADVSVTSCQLLALTAAKEAGIEVPDETIDRAVAYLTDCQNEDGGFRYLRRGGASGLPRSAAALAALEASGRTMRDILARGREYLNSHRETSGDAWQKAHFYYAVYFSVQAMGRASNEGWENWRERLTEAVLASRRDDGSWQDENVGPAYATAVACYVLNYPEFGK